MELNVIKKSVVSSGIIGEYNDERMIESDVLLPDYFAEVLRILKCYGTSIITDKIISGDKVLIKGIDIVKIYYAGPDNELCEKIDIIPFEGGCSLNGSHDDCIVIAAAESGKINCRAVSPRRLYLNGSVEIKAKIIEQKYIETVKDADGEGMQIKINSFDTAFIVGNTVDKTEVSEEFENSEEGNIRIVYSSAKAIIKDYKIVPNKVILKGDLQFKYAYRKETGEIGEDEKTIPISKITDIAGVDEDDECEVFIEAGPYGIENIHDGKKLKITAEAIIQVKVMKLEKTELAVDGYSTKCRTVIKGQEIGILKQSAAVSDTFESESFVELDSDRSEIIKTWIEINGTEFIKEDGKNKAIIRIAVCVIARGNDGELTYFEKQEKRERELEDSETGEKVYDIVADIDENSYSISENRASLKYSISLNGKIFEIVDRKAIESVETYPEEDSENKNALTLYYAEVGESVWEIAKKYRTSVEAVKEDNGIKEDEIKEKSMLFIPSVR